MDDIFETYKKEAMQKYGFGIDEMKKIKVCSCCGAPQKAENVVCDKCQNPLGATLYEEYKSRHLTCSRCGEVVANNSKYCHKCGNKLVNN